MAEHEKTGGPAPAPADQAPAARGQAPVRVDEGTAAAASAARDVPPAPVQPGALRASDRERDEIVSRLQIAFADGRIDADEFDTRVRGVLDSRTRGELVPFIADLPGAGDAGLPAALAAASSPGAALVPAPAPSSGASAGRLSLAYKTSLRRGGRWRVPSVFTAVSYKGGTVLDLRTAEFTSPHTVIRAVAYKCRVTVYVAPGTRIQLSGIGVTDYTDSTNSTDSLIDSTDSNTDSAGAAGSTDTTGTTDTASAIGAGGGVAPSGLSDAVPGAAPHGFLPAAPGPTIRIRGLAYKGVVEIRMAPPGAPAAPGRVPELPR